MGDKFEHGQTGPYLANVWKEASGHAIQHSNAHLELSGDAMFSKTGRATIPSKPEEIHSLLDHALYYSDCAHRREFDEWRESSKAPPPIADLHESARIAVADLTPPELLESPFRVVRALARGLQPIHCGYGFERSYTATLSQRVRGRPAHTAPLPIC